jgi:cytochrome c5
LASFIDMHRRVSVKREFCFGSQVLAVSGLVLMVSGVTLAGSDDEVLERIRPIGRVNLVQPVAAPAVVEAPAPAAVAAETAAPVAAAPVESEAPAGKKTYDTVCFVCHAAGISNAPKFGDKATWEPRIAKGIDALLHSTINGVPGTAMPPRGTCAACSDADLKAAVEYMISQAK